MNIVLTLLRSPIVQNLLRAAISFGLLAYLFYGVDIDKIFEAVRQTRPAYFALALLIFLAALFLFTLRWKLLLMQAGVQISYWRLSGFYFIGYFFNNFLPTMIGGDVSRAYYAARQSGRRAASVGSILLERILGFLATLTLASCGIIAALPHVVNFSETIIVLIVSVTFSLLIIVIFMLINLLNRRFYKLCSTTFSRITIFQLGEKINKVLLSVHAFRQSKSIILWAFSISLICQGLLVLMNYVLVLSLNIEKVSIAYLFFVVPVTFVMGLIPSINGLGVRDFGYKELLAPVGLLPELALSLSFLNTIVPMLMSLIGGILLIFYRKSSRRAAMEDIATPGNPPAAN